VRADAPRVASVGRRRSVARLAPRRSFVRTGPLDRRGQRSHRDDRSDPRFPSPVSRHARPHNVSCACDRAASGSRPAAFANSPAVECPGVQEGGHDVVLPAGRAGEGDPAVQRALGKGEARLQRQRHLIRLSCRSAKALAGAGRVRAWPRRWAGLPTRSSVSAWSSVPALHTISDKRTLSGATPASKCHRAARLR
jgi:hypothetical protein